MLEWSANSHNRETYVIRSHRQVYRDSHLSHATPSAFDISFAEFRGNGGCASLVLLESVSQSYDQNALNRGASVGTSACILMSSSGANRTHSTISRLNPCRAGTYFGVFVSKRIFWIPRSLRIWLPSPTCRSVLSVPPLRSAAGAVWQPSPDRFRYISAPLPFCAIACRLWSMSRRQSHDVLPKTSPLKQWEWIRTRTGAPLVTSPNTSAVCACPRSISLS